MRRITLLLLFLTVVIISGCATGQGSSGGHEGTSGHHGHHH